MDEELAKLWKCPREIFLMSFVPDSSSEQRSCSRELYAHLQMSPRSPHLMLMVCQLRSLASTGKDLAGFKAWHKNAREK